MALQDEEEETEEMDLGELNLDELEKAVEDLIKGIIPTQQVVLLKEAIINTKRGKKSKTLGVIPESPGTRIHETIKKIGNEKHGRRSCNQ